MIRALLLLLALAGAAPAQAEQAGPLTTEAGVLPRDAAAIGAVVWIHPHYTEGPPPAAPSFMTGRLATAGWDLWRYDRGPGGTLPAPGSSAAGPGGPLGAGVAPLAEGSAALRARGYRRVVLVGESRGAFIMLAALHTPGIADAMVFAAPAAHGRSAARRPQALADFAQALEAAAPGPRLALFLFDDDAWDPDPAARAALFRAAAARLGGPALLVDRPAAPTGHGGLQAPEFDALFGACLARWLDFDGPAPAACP